MQTTLLKLMEETDVPLRSANDLQAQLQAAFEFQRRGGKAAGGGAGNGRPGSGRVNTGRPVS